MDELILAKYRPANLKIQFHNARNLAIINDFAFLIRHPLKNQDQKKRVQNHGVGFRIMLLLKLDEVANENDEK